MPRAGQVPDSFMHPMPQSLIRPEDMVMQVGRLQRVLGVFSFWTSEGN